MPSFRIAVTRRYYHRGALDERVIVDTFVEAVDSEEAWWRADALMARFTGDGYDRVVYALTPEEERIMEVIR